MTDDTKPRGKDHSEVSTKGGNARAAKLTQAQRSEASRKAAIARWRGPLPAVVCGAPERTLHIGEGDNAVEVGCYVLEGEVRVISQRGMLAALGMSTSGGSAGAHRLARFAGGKHMNTSVSADLLMRIQNPVRFAMPGAGKVVYYGYEATILPDLCRAILAARRDSLLQPQQRHIAERAEIVLGAFATVGIIALVDEVTGYQYVRARFALEEILNQFLRRDFGAYHKRFRNEFYLGIWRLKGWTSDPLKGNRPQVVGHYTNDIVYSRLAPGVLAELRSRTPRNESGRLTLYLHQWLTEDVGHPALREHLDGVIMLMDASSTWDQFMHMLNRARPKLQQTIPLPFDLPVPPPEE